MASVFTLEGPSLAKVPRTMMPAFVQRQPRLLNGADRSQWPTLLGDVGSQSQWPQILRGAGGGLGRPRRKPKCVSSGTQICREDDWGDCQCWTSTPSGYSVLRGPGGLELLGLSPTVATIAGFAAAAAVGVALGTGAVWAHKKFAKKGSFGGVLGFSKPRRRRKRR